MLLGNSPFRLSEPTSPRAAEVATPPPHPSCADPSPQLGSLSVPTVFHTLRPAPCPLPTWGSQ